MKKLFGYTWIGWLNIIILQWLFIRLFVRENNNGDIMGYGFMFPVIPLTGWWGNYYPSKRWYINL